MEEAGALLNKHPKTIERWCRQGKLDSAKSGRERFTSVEAVRNHSIDCTKAPIVKVEPKKNVADRLEMVRKELKEMGIKF